MKTARKVSQGIFLVLFLFLFVETQSKGFDTLGYPVRVFLDFDPLILVTTFFAAHAVPKVMLLALILIAMTVVLGRVFCGWVCPLGTLNNMIGALHKRRRAVPASMYKVKYYMLLALLAGSFFTLQVSGILDPLALLIRSFALNVYPLINYLFSSAFDALIHTGSSPISGIFEKVHVLLRGTVLSFKQPFFLQSLGFGVIFLAILLLNLVERRFWCRYLCPLGALLGILARFSLLNIKVSEGCTQCGACALACQADAVVEEGQGRRKSECLACFDCDDPCPTRVVGYGRSRTTFPMDLDRRWMIASITSGILVVPFLRISPHTTNPLLIRPPGSLSEPEFLKRCVRCAECMKVCITNGLQPTLLEVGLEGIWTPRLVPRVGYCEYHCTLCGQVCPTGAIQKLKVAEKVQVKIGLAMIDKNRCLPHAHATPCIACQEVCPTPKKAVWLEDAVEKGRDGRTVALKKPYVDLELCIGCGICEYVCPVSDRPAISVTSIGESRSEENQL